MKQLIRTSVALLWLVAFVAGNGAQAQTAKELIDQMLAASKTINTLSFHQKKLERVNGVLLEGSATIKLNRNPHKVFMINHKPNDGVKVLYIHGTNGNKALVNPGPWLPNLNLDPYGNMMRKDQHHTLHRLGYDFVCGLIGNLVTKYAATLNSHLTREADVVWNGIACYKVVLSTNNFTYNNYTVQSGENLVTIAKKYMLSEHMIKEHNKLSDYDDVKAGQVIKIPSDYAAKAILYLDKQNSLPVVSMIFDDKGLYEKYEFYDLKINSGVSAADFVMD